MQLVTLQSTENLSEFAKVNPYIHIIHMRGGMNAFYVQILHGMYQS